MKNEVPKHRWKMIESMSLSERFALEKGGFHVGRGIVFRCQRCKTVTVIGAEALASKQKDGGMPKCNNQVVKHIMEN